MPPETRAEKVEREQLENPDDIKKAVAQSGKAESTVVLYREDKERLNSYNYLTEMPVGAYKQNTIQARYGGGHYRAIFFNANGQEVRKIEFGIEPPPSSRETNERDGNAEILDRILRRLENNSETRREPTNSSDLATTVLLPIVLQMLQRDPLKEITAVLSILKPTGGGVDALEMYKQMQAERAEGMKLGQTIGNLEAGGSGNDSFMKDAITTFGPPVAALAQSLLTKNQPTPANGVPIVTPNAPQLPATTIVESLQWLLPLKQYLPVLVAKAKAKKNATVYAEMLLEEMSDDMKQKLEASTKDDKFVDQVISAIPEFQQPDTLLWGREFLQTLKDHFEPEEENEEVDDTKAKEALERLRNKTPAPVVSNES